MIFSKFIKIALLCLFATFAITACDEKNSNKEQKNFYKNEVCEVGLEILNGGNEKCQEG